MFSAIVLCLFFASSYAIAVVAENKDPAVNYRYQAEESMKTSASEYPIQGYYPQYQTGGYIGGIRGGYGGKLPIGGAGYGPGYGYGGGIGGVGIGGGGIGGVGIGGGGIGGGYGGGIGGGYGGGIGGGYRGGIGGGYGGGIGGGYGGGIGGGYGGGIGGGYGGGIGGGYGGGIGGGYGGGIGGGYGGGIGGYGGGVGGYGGGLGYGGGIGSYGGGLGHIGGGGYGEQAFYPHGHGGGYVDKKNFVDENKNAGGQSFQKAEGSNGDSGQHGAQGFQQGQVAVKDLKGDSGYYNNQQGDKKGFNDGKSYAGGQQFAQAGGKGEGENQKGQHKKGHAKKGFKSTHHKDESGSEETFYDEANDEGDNFRYGKNEGSFGTNGQAAYKGGQENGQFLADQRLKKGQYDRQYIQDNANADKGQYGQKGYHGNSQGYSLNNGAGQQSLLGKQEANRLYYNQHPHGYVPIHDDSY